MPLRNIKEYFSDTESQRCRFIDPGQQRMGSGSSRGWRMTSSFCERRGGMRRISRGSGERCSTHQTCSGELPNSQDQLRVARLRVAVELSPSALFSSLRPVASWSMLNVRYDGDRDFFIICSNGLDVKTLAH
eukprot:scaffold33501_cov73-Phaeocystis_antarctica.AAC.1